MKFWRRAVRYLGIVSAGRDCRVQHLADCSLLLLGQESCRDCSVIRLWAVSKSGSMNRYFSGDLH